MNQNLIGPRFCSSNQSHFWTIWDLLQSLRSAPGLQAPGATLPPALHEWVCPSCVHPLIGLCLEKHPCEDSMPWPFAQTPACSADFRALSVWPEHTLCGGTQDWGSWGCLSYKERGEANGPLGHWRVIGERKPPLEWAAWKSIVLSLFGGGALQHSIWDLSCLTRDWTYAHCSGCMESQPLDHQGSPIFL